MNLENHTEQMEAVRRDFAELWPYIWEQAKGLGAEPRDQLLMKHVAWSAFLAALNRKQE